MTAEQLLELFDDASRAAGEAVRAIDREGRRALSDRRGQYALDLVADDAALRVLEKAPVAVVSEESGPSGPPDARVTVVLDPVDGSTNASRGIPYWATSLAAVDSEGVLAALVENHAVGTRYLAARGRGAARDGEPIEPSPVVEIGEAVVGVTGRLAGEGPWAQSRWLGSAALELCEVAWGSLDGFVDAVGHLAPWDYLGGLLVCREAGALVVDGQGEELVTIDPDVRRQVVAAGSEALLDELLAAVT